MARRSSRTWRMGCACPRPSSRRPGRVRSKGRAAQLGLARGAGEGAEAGLEGGLDLVLEGVDLGAHGGAVGRRHVAHEREHGGEVALLAEHLGVLGAERLLAGGLGEGAAEAGAQVGEPLVDGLGGRFGGHGDHLGWVGLGVLRKVRGFGGGPGRTPHRHLASFATAPKRGGVVDGDVREDLAVEGDVGLLQAAHEARVRGAVDAGRGVDARDPQRRKSRFFSLRLM